MLSGNQLWDSEITLEMVRCNYKGRKVYTYAYAPQNIYADLFGTAGRLGEKTAIVGDNGISYSYNSFLDMVKQFSQYLYYDQRVRKGDHVALILRNTIEFCVALYALAKLGAVVIPVSTKFKPIEWKKLLSGLPVKLILTESLYEESARAICEEDGPVVVSCKENDGFESVCMGREYEDDPYANSAWEDDFIIMHTSGTTGKSKGVVLTNFNIANAIVSYEKVLGVKEEDSTLIATPIYHVTGLIALLMLFIHCGGKVYLHSAFDAERVLESVKQEGITLLHASPTVFIMLLEQRKKQPKLPSLRIFACGSANMPPRIIRELNEWLPDMEFRTVYGLTESSSAGTAFPDDAAKSEKIGSSGIPVPGIDIKLLDSEGGEAAKGDAGELCMFGSVVLDRYYELEVDTLSRDGWFKTGDIARIDDDGYVYIIDRKKDMINRGGEKVWCNEVENAITRMPQVKEAAVIGVPDSRYGEAVMAVVELKDGSQLDITDLKEYLKPLLAKYKIPEYLEFVKAIPRTAGNKVDKKALRNKYKKLRSK